MKYPNIKSSKISHAQIAKAFGFANVKSFNTTSAHKRYMQGVEVIIETIYNDEKIKQSKLERAQKMVNMAIAIAECALGGHVSPVNTGDTSIKKAINQEKIICDVKSDEYLKLLSKIKTDE